MFYDTFLKLCASAGKSPTSAVNELGLSPAALTFWKNGSTPRAATLHKVAKYFDVPLSDLGGGEESAFFSNVCQLCNINGISLNVLAENIGISAAAVNAWKKGSTPRDATIRKVADYFNVEPDLLRTQNGVNEEPLKEQKAMSQTEILEMIARIDIALKRQGIPKMEFYRAVEITSGAMTQWSQGKTTPRQKSIEKIAKFLGMTTDELMGTKKEVAPKDDLAFPMDVYRSLTPENKRIIEQMIVALANGKSREE